MAWHHFHGSHVPVSTDWDMPIPGASEERSKALYAWERRCRGYDLFHEPVSLEPLFVHYLPDCSAEASGWDALAQPADTRSPLVHFHVLLALEQKVTPGQVMTWFSSLRGLSGPLVLEIIGGRGSVRYQVCCATQDTEVVSSTFLETFPAARFDTGEDALEAAIHFDCSGDTFGCIVDFGLYQAVYRPLQLFDTFADVPHSALVAALANLVPHESAGIQLLAVPAQGSWGQSLVDLVAQFDGVTSRAHPGTHENTLERALRYKLASPLWAVAVRVFAFVGDTGAEVVESHGSRALALCRHIGTKISQEGNSESFGNELAALDDTGYEPQEHAEDLLWRQTRRPGMILSQQELVGLWHPPTEHLRNPRLVRYDPRFQELPPYLQEAEGAVLGRLETGSHGQHFAQAKVDVPWPNAFRNRHAYILGATRMGKSTLLLNLIAQDMTAGRGLCLIDPHGDLAQDVLDTVPPERVDDTLYLNLSDTDYPPSLGLFEATTEWQQRLFVSDILSVLHRLFRSSWGDRLEHILRQVLLTLQADREQRHSLRDIRPLLANASYRAQVLQSVSDPELLTFWSGEFSSYNTSAFAPIYNKLGLLLSSPVTRNIFAQSEGKLNFEEVMQTRRILIVNLAQSLIGEDNAHVLGALLVSKIQLAAMHSLRHGRAERVPFTLYVDEFQNFVVSSFEKILSEAGKAELSLVMANQFLEQLGDGLQSAILSNVGTLLAFRVSAESGHRLEREFGGVVTARELTDLERGQAVVRLGKATDSFRIATAPPPVVEGNPSSRIERIIQNTREQCCKPRSEVEQELVREHLSINQSSGGKVMSGVQAVAAADSDEPLSFHLPHGEVTSE